MTRAQREWLVAELRGARDMQARASAAKQAGCLALSEGNLQGWLLLAEGERLTQIYTSNLGGCLALILEELAK